MWDLQISDLLSVFLCPLCASAVNVFRCGGLRLTFLIFSLFSPYFPQAASAPELLDGYLAAGDLGAAGELLDRLAADPKVPLEVARAAGAVCVRRGQPGLAARYLVRTAARNPQPLLLADLASAQFLAGEFSRAAATLDAMARNGPLAPPLVSLRGLTALRLGHRTEAVRHFRNALAADPEEGTANFYLGTLAAGAGELPAAIRHLEAATRAYRDRYAARYNLALALYRAGRWQDGVNILEKISPDPPAAAEVENLLAQGYDKLDRVREAVEAHQKAIQLDPKNPAYVFDLAVMTLRRRTYDLAEVVLESGVRSFPQDRNLALALGGTYQLRGQMEKAQQLFQRLASAHAKDPLICAYLGNSYFEAGRFEDAVAAFTRGIDLDPANSVLYYQAAVSLVKLGRETDPRVRRFLGKALELDPKLAPACYQLAKIDSESNPARARALLARALRLDPELSEAHFLLSRLCRQARDAQCAEAALRRYEALRARERDRLERDRVKGILFTLEKR